MDKLTAHILLLTLGWRWWTWLTHILGLKRLDPPLALAPPVVAVGPVTPAAAVVGVVAALLWDGGRVGVDAGVVAALESTLVPFVKPFGVVEGLVTMVVEFYNNCFSASHICKGNKI